MSNIFRVAACVLTCGLMLTSISHASDIKANFEWVPAVQDQPPQVGFWMYTPTVIVCEYAPIKEVQIKKAVHFWENLNYQFLRTQYKHDPLQKCLEKNPIGYIVIHLVKAGIKMEDSALAETHFYVDNDTNKIEWAIIYLRTSTPDTVLEHEIGHALGFLHFNKINHLMNSKWTQGGWDTNGLEKKQQ